MQKEILVAKEGFEDIFDILNNKIAEIDSAKDAEIAAVVKAIEEKYAARLGEYTETLSTVSKVEVVEVPDEEPEAAVIEEATEEQNIGE